MLFSCSSNLPRVGIRLCHMENHFISSSYNNPLYQTHEYCLNSNPWGIFSCRRLFNQSERAYHGLLLWRRANAGIFYNTSSVGMNLICTLTLCPGDKLPMGGITSKWSGLGFSARIFFLRWRGIILLVWWHKKIRYTNLIERFVVLFLWL